VLSPRLGLGVHEQFVLYPLLGLTRTRLAVIAAPVALIALYVTAFSFTKSPRTFVANTALTAVSLLIALLLVEMLARRRSQTGIRAAQLGGGTQSAAEHLFS
jgi:preprotein translocase subunit SecD